MCMPSSSFFGSLDRHTHFFQNLRARLNCCKDRRKLALVNYGRACFLQFTYISRNGDKLLRSILQHLLWWPLITAHTVFDHAHRAAQLPENGPDLDVELCKRLPRA